jgi:hypothetical protein
MQQRLVGLILALAVAGCSVQGARIGSRTYGGVTFTGMLDPTEGVAAAVAADVAGRELFSVHADARTILQAALRALLRALPFGAEPASGPPPL